MWFQLKRQYSETEVQNEEAAISCYLKKYLPDPKRISKYLY